MFGIPANVWIAGLMAIVGLGWTFRAWLVPAVSGIPSALKRLVGGGSPAELSDEQKLQALKTVVLHYRPMKCPECDAALKILQAHFFDEAAP